jgi:hypothetical protein
MPPPEAPPAREPSPKSITRQNPGGDAPDPEQAALERLLSQPWGDRADRYRTLHLGLMDSPHWERVKFFAFPTRVAYRFGDEHIGVIALWYKRAEGKDDPESCIAAFAKDAMPTVETFNVQLLQSAVMHEHQEVRGERKVVAIKLVEGSMDSLLGSGDYVGAIAAYESWPGTCLLQGFAAKADKHHELAERVRDRWVREGASRLAWDRRIREAPTFDAR